MGDLNVDCSSTEFNSSNKIYKVCQLFNLDQLIDSATRVTDKSKSIIDIILSSMGNIHHQSGESTV